MLTYPDPLSTEGLSLCLLIIYYIATVGCLDIQPNKKCHDDNMDKTLKEHFQHTSTIDIIMTTSRSLNNGWKHL